MGSHNWVVPQNRGVHVHVCTSGYGCKSNAVYQWYYEERMDHFSIERYEAISAAA